jgi:signal transduction histidine kinase
MQPQKLPQIVANLKIGAKILIPFAFLQGMILVFLGYFIFDLRIKSDQIAQYTLEVGNINHLSNKLYLLQKEVDTATLIYRFKPQASSLIEIEASQLEIRQVLTEMTPLIKTEAGQILTQRYIVISEEGMQHQAKLIEAIKAADFPLVEEIFSDWINKSQQTNSVLSDLTVYNTQILQQANDQYLETTRRLNYLMISILMTTLSISAFLYFYLRSAITERIEALSTASGKLSKGDFEIQIESGASDEIGLLGQSLNEMAVRLKKSYSRMEQKMVSKDKELEKTKAQEKRKDDFISIASHELKTPLTSMKLVVQMMKRRNQNQKIAPLIIQVDEQIKRFANLINDLLDVSKIQAGNWEIRKEHFSLDKALAQSIASVQLATKTHKILLVDYDQAVVYADKDRICQVITNLLTNAVKYSPKANKVEVTISSEIDQVTVCVKDFGCGIDKQDYTKIFDRFYRAGENNENNASGLGMGLYIVSEIIKQHQGKIWLESQKGKGSAFYFSLPLARGIQK